MTNHEPKTIEARRYLVDESSEGTRLDSFLFESGAEGSRTAAVALVEAGLVLVSGAVRSKGYKLQAGDEVTVDAPRKPEAAVGSELGAAALSIDAKAAKTAGKGSPTEAPPADSLPLPDYRLVYEDEHMAVIDKPAGVVVHPGPGHPSGTLVDALKARLSSLSSEGGAERPGIVHRLDKETSGLLLVAKDDEAHRRLSAALKAREVTREYLALVAGEMPWDEGSIDAPISRDPRDRKSMAVVAEGKTAKTHFVVIKRMPGATLLRLRLESGRTHQIRVHLTHIGYPVVGDTMYGGKRAMLLAEGLDGRQFLHATSLTFKHPMTGDQHTFDSELPPELTGLVERISLPAE